MGLAIYSKSVLLWYGAIAQIPSGFRLCDGHQGTPDLRDKFVIGAGNTCVPGNTGGSTQHTHSFSSNIHNHTDSWGVPAFCTIMGSDCHIRDTILTGTTNLSSGLPPYKSLCWIMKL